MIAESFDPCIPNKNLFNSWCLVVLPLSNPFAFSSLFVFTAFVCILAFILCQLLYSLSETCSSNLQSTKYSRKNLHFVSALINFVFTLPLFANSQFVGASLHFQLFQAFPFPTIFFLSFLSLFKAINLYRVMISGSF